MAPSRVTPVFRLRLLLADRVTQVMVPDAEANRIVDEACRAPLIVLRGRTDGAIDSPAEGVIARQRDAAIDA
jgi:hypothetical protein